MCALAAMTRSPGAVDFVDEALFERLLAGRRPDAARVREIIAKSLSKSALDVAETAALLAAK